MHWNLLFLYAVASAAFRLSLSLYFLNKELPILQIWIRRTKRSHNRCTRYNRSFISERNSALSSDPPSWIPSVPVLSSRPCFFGYFLFLYFLYWYYCFGTQHQYSLKRWGIAITSFWFFLRTIKFFCAFFRKRAVKATMGSRMPIANKCFAFAIVVISLFIS